MQYILTGEQMRQADAHTIEQLKVPSIVLMEHAAMEIFRIAMEERFDKRHVLCVCGSGNNGGDAMAVARLLHLAGVDVSVYIAGDPAHFTEQTKIQYDSITAYRIPVVESADFSCYTLILDGIFGVGLSREVKGSYADVIRAVNSSDAQVLAIDIPSGICADTGAVLGCAVQAHETVTMAYAKAGHYYAPGCEYTGRLHVAEIGIKLSAGQDLTLVRKAMEQSDLDHLRFRTDRSNKGDYGKVLIFAGSRGMAGAAVFAAEGAYRSGCGLVKVSTCEENRTVIQTRLPEAMISILDKEAPDYRNIDADLAWADAIVMGPGFGTDDLAADVLRYVLENAAVPCVMDADAITLLANKKISIPAGVTAVITPHPGETARLLGCSAADILAAPEAAAQKAAGMYHCICIQKDHRTVIADEHGQIFINLIGNHGMATGGSGDVLSGVTGALLALGKDPVLSAAAAVYLHGLAGDRAMEKKGPHAMLASDILASL